MCIRDRQGPFRIGADIGRMGLQQRWLTEEPRLAAARTTDHQNVFVSGILRLLWTARHCDSLRLRHGDVLEKVLVHVGSDIRRRAPSGRTILDSVAVFLGVFAFQVDRHAKGHCTGYADQQVRGCLLYTSQFQIISKRFIQKIIVFDN